MGIPTFGRFGDSLSDAVNTEFFAFFHLVPVDREESTAGQQMIHFRSSGQFHDQVLCAVRVDADGGIISISIEIDGSFIEDPVNAIFARDFAKSFVMSGSNLHLDLEQLGRLVQDLEYRPVPGKAHLNAVAAGSSPEEMVAMMLAAIDRGEKVAVTLGSEPRKAAPELPEIASRGFAVYQGDRAAFSRQLATTRFLMENVSCGEGRTVRMTFVRGGTPADRP